MPRPTTAQLAYGSCTVILSTFAMLLLSGTSSGVGIVLIAFAALALGLLVAMAVPLPGQRRTAGERPAPREPVRAAVTTPAPEPVHERAVS
ncbi:hypothetical protein ABZ499_21910 [Streptomyces sp. NPDC019990]|uniref:hypothetical protein n=1 Tax=Streptomyces sp. NPDC019990 TaxID=3154693 RepID=UPI0033F2EE63